MTQKRKDKDWHNTICLDYDGVICEFANPREGQPVEGAEKGIKKLINAGWYVEVYSGRSATAGGIRGMMDWFDKHMPSLYIEKKIGLLSFASNKPVAKIYVDDRGWHFTDWKELTPDNCQNFRTWWQHPDSTE